MGIAVAIAGTMEITGLLLLIAGSLTENDRLIEFGFRVVGTGLAGIAILAAVFLWIMALA
jgi:hypothetical protein